MVRKRQGEDNNRCEQREEDRENKCEEDAEKGEREEKGNTLSLMVGGSTCLATIVCRKSVAWPNFGAGLEAIFSGVELDCGASKDDPRPNRR